jgi:hypothetical protein
VRALRQEDDFVTPPRFGQPAPDDELGVAEAVVLGRIDEVAAQRDERLEQPPDLVVPLGGEPGRAEGEPRGRRIDMRQDDVVQPSLPSG